MRFKALPWLVLSALFLTACTREDEHAFFVGVTFLGFGALASVGSIAGSCFALVHAAQRKPRSYVQLAIAVPFAVAAVGLHAGTTNGFSTPLYGLHRDDFFLVLMTATPIYWLAATVVGVSLAPAPKPVEFPAPAEDGYRAAPPSPYQPPPEPIPPGRVALSIGLPAIAICLYTALLYSVLLPNPPRATPPAPAMETRP
jgi:hypothetical protein